MPGHRYRHAMAFTGRAMALHDHTCQSAKSPCMLWLCRFDFHWYRASGQPDRRTDRQNIQTHTHTHWRKRRKYRRWRKRERARRGSNLRRQRLASPTAQALVAQTTQPVPAEPAEWYERLTPGQSSWLGAAAVGSIPTLALSLFLQDTHTHACARARALINVGMHRSPTRPRLRHAINSPVYVDQTESELPCIKNFKSNEGALQKVVEN